MIKCVEVFYRLPLSWFPISYHESKQTKCLLSCPYSNFEEEKITHLRDCKAKIYFLQEVLKNTHTKFLKSLPENQYKSLHVKENSGGTDSYNCIIYKRDCFKVYKISIGQIKVQCALSEEKWPWDDASLRDKDKHYDLRTA